MRGFLEPELPSLYPVHGAHERSSAWAKRRCRNQKIAQVVVHLHQCHRVKPPDTRDRKYRWHTGGSSQLELRPKRLVCTGSLCPGYLDFTRAARYRRACHIASISRWRAFHHGPSTKRIAGKLRYRHRYGLVLGQYSGFTGKKPPSHRIPARYPECYRE